MPRSRKPALDHEPFHPTKGTERPVVGLMEGQADGLGHFSVTLLAWGGDKGPGTYGAWQGRGHNLHAEPCAHLGWPGREGRPPPGRPIPVTAGQHVPHGQALPYHRSSLSAYCVPATETSNTPLLWLDSFCRWEN